MRFISFTSLLFLFLSIHLQAYNPVEVFTISCGTTGKSFDNERTWTGDTNSNFVSPQNATVSAQATTQATSANQVPFSTARLSRSQFNYSFPVTTGPIFLRLFFYPASYPSFRRSHASFTVQANQFTLLSGFNASLNADGANTETIFKEYVLYVDDRRSLTLTFTPSQPNSYAFINGIEVLSMPNNLYYTPPDDSGFNLVGHQMLFRVESSAALEMNYRIKVGGQGISPRKDTGLFRDWAGHDKDYFTTKNQSLFNLPGDVNGDMNVTVNPDYVAPKDLYRTARDMGMNGTRNKISNLTWEFPVLSGFTYMLRLHFCELDPNINDIGDRVFFIYIATPLADSRADVMRWTQKQKGLAVYKDYAVPILKNDTQKMVNLSLQMHPYESNRFTMYSDPYLNGLEIFKISDNLAEPNPDPVQSAKYKPVLKGKSSNGTTIIGVVAGVVSSVVLITLMVFFVVLSATSRTKCRHLSISVNNSTHTQNSYLLPDLCRNFPLVDIKAATKNFDDVLIVGVGGFGHVYKGYIQSDFNPVAIKRLKPDSLQGEHEFMNEIEMLSQLRHLHLVSLVGFCNENNEMVLVYDFMERGTLREHLYDTDNPPLPWKQRLQICIGAARGLHYLHTGAKHTIIHRDVKTTNILLDEKWVAKVSDFGLSRIGPTGISKAHVSTFVKGSFGYIDPEYYKRYRLTEKSDVYSFGVVLFETLCARPPLIHHAEPKQVSLANWARLNYKNGTMAQIVDPTLKGMISPECFKKFCEIGMSCLLEDGTQRPSMNDVVGMLEFALQLQQTAERNENDKREEISDDTFTSELSATSGEHSDSYNDSYNSLLSWNPFSEIMDPKPR